MELSSPKKESISFHSHQLDITDILERFKSRNNKLSPLPLNQFSKISDNQDLLQQQPIGEIPNFLSFRELNQGAVDELKRSLQQSKSVWNNYSKYLFGENSIDEIQTQDNHYKTSRKLLLIHNRETFHKIRKQCQQQEEQQLLEVKKALMKIHSQTVGVKIYPSLAYQDQQKLELLRRQVRMGGIQNQQGNDAQNLQKRILESQVALNQIKQQCAYIYGYENHFWGPSSRDGSTMITYDRKLYMYGGSSVVQQEDLCIANIDKQFYKWNPQKLDEKSIHGYRVHHTAGIYKTFMILFGGEIHIEQSNHKIVSECTSDVKTISLHTFDVKMMKQPGIIQPRKCHISEIVGRYLIVFGGIDNRGNYLRDLLCYDIPQQKWIQLNYDPYDCYIDGIAFHKSCLATQNKFCDIYRQDPELKFNNQGIYIFGGQNKSGDYLNTLTKIDIYQKPIKIEQVEYKGQCPIARCQHSMNYNELLGAIIIYGGKNDDNTHEGFLNDLNYFDVKNLQWTQIDLKGSLTVGRCGHSSACIDTKLYIFGGCNYNGFVKNDILIIELDSNIANQLVQQEREEKPRYSTIKIPIQQEPEKKIDKFTERKLVIEKLHYRNSQQIAPISKRVSQFINALKFGQKQNTSNDGSNSNRASPKQNYRKPKKHMTFAYENKELQQTQL